MTQRDGLVGHMTYFYTEGVRRFSAVWVIRAIFALQLTVFLYAQPGNAVERSGCSPLTVSTLQTLSSYVQQKYRLPFVVKAAPEDLSFVKDTCYRRIRFKAADAGHATFALLLYLSPDTRFLSRDLLDSTADPIVEEEEENRGLRDSLATAQGPSLGSKNPIVTITVFSDFQCPYCKKQAQILRDDILPSEGDVRLVFRNLPLTMHDWSRPAAVAATCAASQSDQAFWILHDYIFKNQSDLHLADIVHEIEGFADSTSLLDGRKFRTCFEQRASEKLVDSDIALAQRYRIESTPTVFVNSIRINGVASSEQLHTLIHQLRKVEAARSESTKLGRVRSNSN